MTTSMATLHYVLNAVLWAGLFLTSVWLGYTLVTLVLYNREDQRE